MNPEIKFYPKEENLGNPCKYWDDFLGCTYPREEVTSKRFCQGTIDEVCLYAKDKRTPINMSPEEAEERLNRVYLFDIKKLLPPSNKT